MGKMVHVPFCISEKEKKNLRSTVIAIIFSAPHMCCLFPLAALLEKLSPSTQFHEKLLRKS